MNEYAGILSGNSNLRLRNPDRLFSRLEDVNYYHDTENES
jgi:hypothetical protein